ncbi:aldehyde dehydrogenase [Rossellomorea aquimaris]|uniref:Aldehyde dehydrogenase n=1 Tax=Rossellomorea aquimaris TaxID=189382 RepID=A0A5D4UQL1_9BACI|nr:aldehyde dehydrogenase family protein [Rossellomorea aquimaris]TYS76727.1 aldehyde dehydrogenase [Rossellomorea aquimaris]TYS83632.1 aldehyde dehydrogenase [Rossellomorea aquimaris]TYS89181.1 aldehyde dehydrogenase [Rossellomorea aquimaris]
MEAAMQILDYPLYINGEWKPAKSGETFEVVNPATGEVAAKVAKAGKEDVEEAVSSARRAFDSGVWSKKSPQERADVLVQFGNKILEHAEELGYLESISSGATVRRISNLDILSIVDLLQQTAKFTVEYAYVESLPTVPFPGPSNNQIWREPIGVVAAVTPWNFPMILAMWKLAPALAMGNSIVIKPASNTPLSTLKLAKLAAEAGIPAGVFNVVSGPGASIGEELVTHPSIDKVAFTGSTEVGRRIMQMASGTVKRVTLELGGKSPAIVLPDADLDITIPGILFGFLTHSGQVCVSGTRVLVHDSIYEQVIEQLSKLASSIKIGNPLDMGTGMGPLVSKQQLNSVLSYIESGVQEGARLVCGGKRRIVEGFENGYYIEPTIFAEVHNDMKIAREEIFGPVLSVIRYSTVEEAIEIANDTIYGLAGGVWSKDVNKAMKIARELKAGTIWINDWHMMRSDAPFGGYKQSGFGRELGRQALDEYSQVKHVHCSLVPEVSQRPWYQMLLG